MKTRPEVIEELRTLFKNGATPSRLIRHIAARHDDEERLHFLVQDYFMEAFGIPIVRGLDPTDDYQPSDFRHAFLSEQLLHQMIEKLSEWHTRADGSTKDDEPWFTGLVATPDEARMGQAQSAPVPDLAGCWPKLSQKEQSYMRAIMASANGLHETVKILSRLAETLQQKIDELEVDEKLPVSASHPTPT
jgi:hypothetical protein